MWTKRASGTKLVFYDLHGDGAKVQVMADARHSELDAEAFAALHASSRRGDIVGVVGHPSRTKKGELSIVPTSFQVLSPCLHQLPKGPTGITNQVGSVQQMLWVLRRELTPVDGDRVRNTSACMHNCLYTHALVTGNALPAALPGPHCQPAHSVDL